MLPAVFCTAQAALCLSRYMRLPVALVTTLVVLFALSCHGQPIMTKISLFPREERSNSPVTFMASVALKNLQIRLSLQPGK